MNRVAGLERGGHAFPSPDGRFVLIDSASLDSDEQRDIYVSFRNDDGTWGEAKPLGPSVNTEYSETCPSLSPDGRYLSFLASRKTDERADDPKAQVWLLDRRGSEAQQLTEVMQGVTGLDVGTESVKAIRLHHAGDKATLVGIALAEIDYPTANRSETDEGARGARVVAIRSALKTSGTDISSSCQVGSRNSKAKRRSVGSRRRNASSRAGSAWKRGGS